MVFFGAGAFARRSTSSSAARSIVIDSTASALRSEAFVSPSVTYGPNLPSLTTTGLPVSGSSPSSRSGGAVAARRPRVLGCASSANASSRVTVKSCSSDSSERESVPRLTYGPYRPFCAVISSPAASLPRTRGSVSSRSASSSDTVSMAMVRNRLAVRLPACTYGPNRPALATTGSPVSASVPSSRSPDGTLNSSSAFAAVSSSGGRSSGRLARSPPASSLSPPRCRYGPYRPTRTTTSSNSGIEFTPRASIWPRRSETIFFSPPAAAIPPSRPVSEPK